MSDNNGDSPTWSPVRLAMPFGTEAWGVFHSDCKYLNKSGEWGPPAEAATFDNRQQAAAFGRQHFPAMEYKP